jgi:hypothetical protein
MARFASYPTDNRLCRCRQDVKTKKRTVMDKKPAATEYTTVGDDGVVYKTRVEAENAMKTVKVCTTN